MRRKGFTLIELLVVVAIIALLISILLPSLARAREMAKRAVCSANQRAIGQACHIYSNDNADALPVAPFKQTTAATNNQHEVDFVGKLSTNLTLGYGTGGVDLGQVHVSRSLFMLMGEGSTTPGSFTCPSSGDTPDDLRNKNGSVETAAQPGVNRFDFKGYSSLSFGYHMPFGPKARPNQNLDPRMALTADKGPFFDSAAPNDWMTPDGYASGYGSNSSLVIQGASTPDQILKLDNDKWRPYNSRNHSSEGQNVMYMDGHVEFMKKPIVGVNYDGIESLRRWPRRAQ